MIARDAAPIAHTPPRPRIDLSARQGGDPSAHPVADMTFSPAECDRIWQLVRQTATGTNPPAEVCTDGWDAA